MKYQTKISASIACCLLCIVDSGNTANDSSLADKNTPIGLAMLAGKATGGGKVPPTKVKTLAELMAAVQDDAPRVVHISGTSRTIDESRWSLDIKSNKTIKGVDKHATICGGIAIKNATNVIVRNLNIQGTWPESGPGDTVAVKELDHVWLNHLNIWNAGDENLDTTRESNCVTVSWCKFWYTNEKHGHRFNGLIGSGGGDHPEDWAQLKVTYHHNWFAEFVDHRMPRLIYGHGHIFNNFYTSKGNSYCNGAGSYGMALLENNCLKDVKDPHEFMYDVYCDITTRGDIYDNPIGNRQSGRGGDRSVSGQDFEVVPFEEAPDKYPIDDAEDVPAIVSRLAGPQ